MRIIAIANQKGGTGKTTTACCFADILKAQGHRVLIVDGDRQENATDSFKAEVKGVATLYDVLTGESPIAEAIQHTERGDIIAGDALLTELKNLADLSVLRKSLRKLSKKYDFVVIDTPPADNAVMLACLIAADDIIIPVCCGRHTTHGVFQIMETIHQTERFRPVGVVSLLVNQYDGRSNAEKISLSGLKDVSEQLGISMFSTTVSRSVKVLEAEIMRTPLHIHAPKSKPTEQYNNIVKEYLERID